MSDGGTDATLDHRRIPQSSLGAAPWERFAQPPSGHGVHLWQAEPALADPAGPAESVEPTAGETEKAGCHADGEG